MLVVEHGGEMFDFAKQVAAVMEKFAIGVGVTTEKLSDTDDWRITAAEAATLAAASGVKQLVLTHISGRYGDEEILGEATKVFPNSRVARDFDRIVI